MIAIALPNWPTVPGLNDFVRAGGADIYNLAGVIHTDNAALAEQLRASYDPLPYLKALKIGEIKALFRAKVAAGFTYAGHVYQIDDTAQLNMTSVKSDFNGGTVNAHGGYWRDAANADVAMTDAECLAFLGAAKAYKMGCIRRAQALVNAVVAADQTAFDALDITAGWP